MSLSQLVLLFLFGAEFLGSGVVNGADADGGANIIFLMLDDLGRADIGALGAEWRTPNIDDLIANGVTLTHHYVGYVCSASRSQFLTGRYAFHSGFGTLNVFDINRLGTLPLGTPTIMEYLKHYSNYQTYGIGKWQLGMATEESLASNRGFDYFLGFNGGLEDYFTKHRSLESAHSFLDFLENDQPTEEYSGEYSTDQYISKMMEIIDSHANNEELEDKPFFIYAGFQAIHSPFAYDTDNEEFDYTDYYQTCKNTYLNKIKDFEYRIGVCEAMIGFDTQLGVLMEHFQSSDKLKEIWDNTIIVFTSDNGGSIDTGSCNYPLRGGKNTFFEGNQRVLAVVGGGKLPESRQGTVLDGLVSNVDWVPTLLAFANVIPTDEYIATNVNEKDYSSASLDGYNMYEYIMKDNSQPLRDHIMLHLLPSMSEDDDVKLSKSIGQYTLKDMEETAIIFYDSMGRLMKYFDAAKSTNPIGNPVINSGWCVVNKNMLKNGNCLYTKANSDGFSETMALFDVSGDVTESQNLLSISSDPNKKIYEISEFDELTAIIEEKIEYYVSVSQNRNFLYGNFECFTSDKGLYDSELFVHAMNNGGAWMPFYSQPQFLMALRDHCGLTVHHKVFELFTSDWSLPDDLSEVMVGDNEKWNKINRNVPEDGLERVFVHEMEIDLLGAEWQPNDANAALPLAHETYDDKVVGQGETGFDRAWAVLSANVYIMAAMGAICLMTMVICCAYLPMRQKSLGYVPIV